MNAIATEVTEQLSVDDALAQVKLTVAQLRAVEAEYLANEASAARGRERLSAAAAEVARIDSENAAAVARHAKRLEQQARAGDNASVPTLAPSEKHLLQELAAERTHQAAVAMMQSLQSSCESSAGHVAAARALVDTALATLRTAEIHHRIHDGLVLLDQFEQTYAEIHARTEVRGDSSFGDGLHDTDRDHQRLRAVWDCLAARRMGPDSHGGVLAVQPALERARAALRERDAELITDHTKEQTQ